MKNVHTKKLNKSNFRIFFMETQIYLCHKFEVSRWKMSLKTIHNTYLLICSLYFNDNINNVVEVRITEIRIQNYNRKQLTNKCDEKISRNKWKLGISQRWEMFIRCIRLKRRVVPDSQKIMMGTNCGVRQPNTNE